MHYLLKTEPTAYSFADLLRDKGNGLDRRDQSAGSQKS